MQENAPQHEGLRSIIKSDGSTWTQTEIRKVFGESRIVEKFERSTKYICVEDKSHKSAELEALLLPDDTIGFHVCCRQCAKDYGILYEDQFNTLCEWLSDKELIDGRWTRHQNPFDHDGKAAVLEFVKDAEGNPLLYRGGIHLVYGKPGTFKSWFALSTILEADIRLWDFENGISATLQRLKALGATREQSNGYTVPSSPEEIISRVREYTTTKPEILCIDGFSGFADVMGINPDSNSDVMRAYTDVFFPLKRAGVTVVVLDHLPKDSSTDDFPIGAQAKKSQADAAFLFKRSSLTDQVDVFVSKDRHGEILERCEAGSFPRRLGTLSLKSEGESISVSVSPSYEASIHGTSVTASDAQLMQSIYDYVLKNPDSSKVDIERNILGKTERKRKALAFLKAGEYISTRTVGTSHFHNVEAPFTPEWKALGA